MKNITQNLDGKITIYNIAKALDISPATVSRALLVQTMVTSETRKMVVHIAFKLGYRPNKLVSALKSGKTYTIVAF
jgi:LacI family transcriptional regulator